MKVADIKDILEQEARLDFAQNFEIKDISYDSRTAAASMVFVALKGYRSDGHDYVEKAYAQGVRVFVLERWLDFFIGKEDVTVYVYPEGRKALALLARAFFSYPDLELLVIAVTGTKGKTTVTETISASLNELGLPTAYNSTHLIAFGEVADYTANTTPESYVLYSYMRKFLDLGAKAYVLECTSGGLMHHRTWGIKVDYAIFTNLGLDHIGSEEHPNFEHYRWSKSQLFLQAKTAILNGLDPNVEIMAKNCQSEPIYYGIGKGTSYSYQVEDFWQEGFEGQSFTLRAKDQVYEAYLNRLGKFNLENALAVIAVLSELGYSFPQIMAAINSQQVPGRGEVHDFLPGVKIMIDYAHTGDSFEQYLSTYKDLENRLVILFGAIGERSKDRRKEMAEVASKYADVIYVTVENPRDEDPRAIIEDSLRYIDSSLSLKAKEIEVFAFEDRREAITQAVRNSRPGDYLFLLCRGAERAYMIQGVDLDFTDYEIAFAEAQRLESEN